VKQGIRKNKAIRKRRGGRSIGAVYLKIAGHFNVLQS
jgi:hypothetical protein